MSRKTKQVLFLCVDNYLNSRYAEIYFNDAAKKADLDWEASSRAIAPSSIKDAIGPMSPWVYEALNQDRIHRYVPERFPLRLEVDDIDNADLIFVFIKKDQSPLNKEIMEEIAEKDNRQKITWWIIPSDLMNQPISELLLTTKLG